MTFAFKTNPKLERERESVCVRAHAKKRQKQNQFYLVIIFSQNHDLTLAWFSIYLLSYLFQELAYLRSSPWNEEGTVPAYMFTNTGFSNSMYPSTFVSATRFSHLPLMLVWYLKIQTWGELWLDNVNSEILNFQTPTQGNYFYRLHLVSSNYTATHWLLWEFSPFSLFSPEFSYPSQGKFFFINCILFLHTALSSRNSPSFFLFNADSVYHCCFYLFQ